MISVLGFSRWDPYHFPGQGTRGIAPAFFMEEEVFLKHAMGGFNRTQVLLKRLHDRKTPDPEQVKNYQNVDEQQDPYDFKPRREADHATSPPLSQDGRRSRGK